MATAATARPATPGASATPVPTPVTPATTTLSPTRRRTARPAPPARVVYTRFATAGEDDDRIVNAKWNTFKTAMVYVGGILFFFVFGILMFACGVMGAYRTHPSTQEPQVIKRVIEQPVSTPNQVPVVQPAAPAWSSRWPSRDDCEYHYKVVLHEAPAGRCD